MIKGGYVFKRGRCGFTIVELIIAIVIFVLFLSGVFQLYRMGSNMFFWGSWKHTKQKEAQRFLHLLKKRMEMASSPTKIDPTATTDNTRIASVPIPIWLPNETTIPAPGSTQNLFLFSICKPDLSMTPGGSQGMVFAHVLKFVPALAPYASLLLYGNAGPGLGGDASFGPEYPPGPFGFGAFDALPSTFQLGAAPFQSTLSDVKEVKINWQIASGTTLGSDDFSKVITLTVLMEYGKHKQTQVSQTVQIKVDPSVAINNQNIGSF